MAGKPTRRRRMGAEFQSLRATRVRGRIRGLAGLGSQHGRTGWPHIERSGHQRRAGVGFNAGGDTIAVVTRTGDLHLVDWRQGVNLAASIIVAHSGKDSFHLVFDPDGVDFATSGEDGVVQLWDVLSEPAACAAAGRRLDPSTNDEILRGTKPIGCSDS